MHVGYNGTLFYTHKFIFRCGILSPKVVEM